MLILEGVRILDCTRDIAGPVATMLAAEMGADVVKVEPPGGDEMRHWPPFVDGESVYFVSCNVQVSNDLQWRRFCGVLGAAELAGDSRFAGNPERVKNRDVLRPMIRAHLETRDAQEWEKLLTAAGVPVSHVRRLGDVVAEEQVTARNMIKPTRLRSGREIPTWGVPVKVNGQVGSRTLGVPGLDEHRDEILADLERRTGPSRG